MKEKQEIQEPEVETQVATKRAPKRTRTHEYVHAGKHERSQEWATGTYQGIVVGRGPGKRIIDPEEVRRLAAIGMRKSDIARWFDVNDDSLGRNFGRELEMGRLQLRERLRQAQIDLALSGNAIMLIFLGKNYLEQADIPRNTEDRQPLPWTDA